MRYIRIKNGEDYYDIPATNNYQVSYVKLWAGDTNRAMDGTYTGTIIGIFPKIAITWPTLTGSQQSLLLSIFNKPSLHIEWWDAAKQQYNSGEFQTSDVNVGVLLADKDLWVDFSAELTALKRI